jgi:hypothetical protein
MTDSLNYSYEKFIEFIAENHTSVANMAMIYHTANSIFSGNTDNLFAVLSLYGLFGVNTSRVWFGSNNFGSNSFISSQHMTYVVVAKAFTYGKQRLAAISHKFY